MVAAPQQTKEGTGDWTEQLSIEGIQGEAEDPTSTKGEWTKLGLEQLPQGTPVASDRIGLRSMPTSTGLYQPPSPRKEAWKGGESCGSSEGY